MPARVRDRLAGVATASGGGTELDDDEAETDGTDCEDGVIEGGESDGAGSKERESKDGGVTIA